MASRKEQKEQARARRLAEEEARAERERRNRRLQMLAGVTLTIVAIAAVGIAIGAGGGGGKGTGAPIKPAANGVKLPPQKIADLTAATKAAGCTVIDTPDSIARTDQNRQHVSPGTKVNYLTNPPSFGPHYPAPASDGEYKPSNTPAIGYLVHAMEHGRIEYQYRPGLPQADVQQVESLLNEGDGSWAPGQLLLLFQNPTGMPYDVAATAWGHVLGCKSFNPRVFDAFRAFRLAYAYKAPEMLGTGPE
jgi:uncharacterized protein DUF3105